MARTHYLQSAFVAGVLDPRLAARTDIRQYYQGMSVGENVVPVPLGGAKRRPGQKYVDQLGYTQTAQQAAATATAPRGGTANNARDDDWDTVVLTTVNVGVIDPYIVIHYDLGAQVQIRSWDILGISLSSGTSTGFGVQWSTDNAAWNNAGGPNLVDQNERSYRARFSSPGVTARYWRVARFGATDLGAARVTLRDFLLWSEGTTISSVRLPPFAISTDDAYIVAATDRALAIYDVDTDDFVATVPSPYPSADLQEIDYAQSAEAAVLVQEDYAPRLLVRDTINSLWWIEQIEFTNIPDFDFADSNSPAVTADVQDVTFTNFVEGNTFQLELEGARSGTITYQGVGDAAHQAATAENIRRAVQKLYTVGLAGVSVAFTAGTTFRITFGEDSADNLDVITGTPLTAGSTAAITAVKITNGVSRREPVWSDVRGWPRTVTFHEGRLYFGGSRSLPQSLFGSVVNDFFNFDLGAGLDDDAIFITLNTAQLNKITGLFSGRDLQIFTSGGEFRQVISPITPANCAPKNQTQYGTAQIKPVSTDGATAFVQKRGKVLRDFLFRYEEDAYSSVPLSALATHLLNSVVDMAAWQGDGEDDANLVFLVNTDGTLAVHVTLRSQEIAAWSTWNTDGSYKAAGVAETARYVAVQRSINSVNVLYLERFNEDYRLDAAKQGTFLPPGQSTISNVGHLNGEDCRVRSGNIVLDNATPSAGSANITGDGSAYAVTDFEIGLDWHPLITTMPLNSNFGNGDNYLRKKRVTHARIHVFESLGLLYNGRELPDDYFDLDNFDEAPEPFTGVHSLEESSNWDEGPLTQSLSQNDPLPFHILGLDLTVESS